MPRMEKVEDPVGVVYPFRITRGKGRRTSARRSRKPHIRIKCGCCDQAVGIYHEDKPSGNANIDTLEINGVYGTVDQWRKVLLPLLGVKA